VQAEDWCIPPAMTDAKQSLSGDLTEVVTVGLPFCAFKGLVGSLLVTRGHFFGAGLLALAATDAAFNVVNLATLVTRGQRLWSTCLLSAIAQRTRLFKGASSEYLADFGSSLDVMLSFTVVALMVGLSQIGTMPPDHIQIWNGAVVLNVLGAGLSRFRDSVTRRPRAADHALAATGMMRTSGSSSSGAST